MTPEDFPDVLPEAYRLVFGAGDVVTASRRDVRHISRQLPRPIVARALLHVLERVPPEHAEQ